MNNKKNTDNSSSFIPPPSSLRVLLWDLDGTLVHGKRFGAFKDYTVPMLEKVFGTAGSLHGLIVSGMTDLQILPGSRQLRKRAPTRWIFRIFQETTHTSS